MSTFMNPVGPQPSNVYWRRRLVFGGVLLAVIIIILLIVFSPKGDATPTPTKTTPSSQGGGETNAALDPDAEADACNPDAILLEPITDLGSYQTGQQPLLSMKITNLGATACSLDVGTDVQNYQIMSGSDAIWNSKDCQVDPAPASIVLEPGADKAQSTTPFPWDRTRSSTTTCDGERPQVAAGGGTYRLTVVLGDTTSLTDKAFLLY